MEKRVEKFKLKKPKNCEGMDWNSDMEEDDFVKPQWVVRQEEVYAKRQATGSGMSFIKSNRDSILEDSRMLCSLRAQDARDRKARRLAKKEENKQKMYDRLKEAKKRRKAARENAFSKGRCTKEDPPMKSLPPEYTSTKEKDDNKPLTTPLQTYTKERDDNKPLTTPIQSDSTITTSTPPSNISTLSTVISADSVWSRYSGHNSGTMKLKGDHVLFPSFDVTLSLENATCIACKKYYKECNEMKYRDFCLHSVTDYIQEVGSINVTDAGLRKVYRDAFMVQVRLDILKRTGYYETNKVISLPWCMVQGSLVECLNLATGTPAAQYIMTKRMSNVEEHVKDDHIPFTQSSQ